MADSRLSWFLCDKDGAMIAPLPDRHSAQVKLAINDIRNGTVGISIEDQAVALASSMDTRIKAFLGEQIVLNAPLFLPHHEGAAGQEGTTQLSATDNVQLATAFTAGLGNFTAVDQGEIMWELVQHAAAPRFDDGSATYNLYVTSGVPGHGIVRGSIPATINRDYPHFDMLQIWGALTGLAALDGGVDFELEPLDRDDGVFMQLNTFNRRQGTDKSDTVILEVGTGRSNADGWSWEPSGEQLVNLYVLAGATDPTTGGAIAVLVQNVDSQQQFGLYAGVEIDADIDMTGTTLSGADPFDPPVVTADAEIGRARAKRVVGTRAFPIDTFTIIPAVEQNATAAGWARDETGELVIQGEGYHVPPRFAPDGDYWLGDTIGVLVKEGGVLKEMSGRVVAATLNEIDQAGNVAVELTCIPTDIYVPPTTYDFTFVHLGDASQVAQGSSVGTAEPPSTPAATGGGSGILVKKPPKGATHPHKPAPGDQWFWEKKPGKNQPWHWEQHPKGWKP